MYTGDTASSVSRRSTKSTIEALLRNKEKCSITTKPVSADPNKDKGYWSNYSVPSDFDFGGIPQNVESDTKNIASPDHVFNSDNSQENLEHQKDFNYSQKLFHIADGNLYSIFSPIQGRSYGMKPSFLRKQKYTVQECHNRGRKNLRKGLKFHNFLPSESVTSEKDSGYLNPKWKVYSECRLREEHGTKQITISNWSQSVQNPPPETATTEMNVPSPSPTAETNCSEPPPLLKSESTNELEYKTEPSVSNSYDFHLNTQPYDCQDESVHLNLNSSRTETGQKCSASSSSKKDSLDILLNSLIQKPLISERSNYSNEAEFQNKCFQKHRRKQVQTRRIVPYVKYLSIMEENETLPLDLSSKCLIENSSSHSISSCNDLQNFSGKTDLNFSNDDSAMICDKNKKNAISKYVTSNNSLSVPNMSSDKLMPNSALNDVMRNSIQTPVTFSYPFPFNKNSNLSQNGLFPPPLLGPSSSVMEMKPNQNVPTVPVNRSYGIKNHSLPNNSQFSVQKSFVKEVQSKPRRRNQRSAIKQKLEDTFRQNGFLVKTKQVSDGEATFCKFRQLRKYTRYYLKSLEQHLPDEFNKMWKGFLPPKTVLPSVSGMQDRSNESSM